jgi:mono/diheme cytochrome c family protein
MWIPGWLIFAAVFAALFATLFATKTLWAQPPQGEARLTAAEERGRLVFQQRCSVCHAPLALNVAKTYGPRLYSGRVQGREQIVEEAIRNGRGELMPGFEYGLSDADIAAVLDYLKTLPRPAQMGSWY